MAEAERFYIGAGVDCSDGHCGQVRRVVIDPLAKAITHLVVEPKHGFGTGRLVPIDMTETTDQGVRVRCTSEEFERFEPAEETQFVPNIDSYPGYRHDQLMAWPYYGLGTPGMAADMPQTVTSETVPAGEVDVRRGDRVWASDGEIGRVQGLVMDTGTRQVTHVLLQEGHLWGRKQVAIPVKSVSAMGEGVEVGLSKEEIANLPPVDIVGLEERAE